MSNYGLIFPIRFTDGSITPDTLEDSIISSIKNILAYDPNQRAYMDDFYGGIYRYLQEPNVTDNVARIEELVIRAITRFEPRVSIVKVTVGNTNETVEISLEVIINETQRPLEISINE
jgi:phage baseplate assembly protein W